jgi:hypothetical protein
MLVIETDQIIVEANDDGAVITTKGENPETLTLNPAQASQLWSAIILHWKAHAEHVFSIEDMAGIIPLNG